MGSKSIEVNEMIKTVQDSNMILTLKEDLIAPNVKGFESALATYLGELDNDGIEELVLDLSNCENIDSVGVTFVVSLYKNVIREGKNFRVLGATAIFASYSN